MIVPERNRSGERLMCQVNEKAAAHEIDRISGRGQPCSRSSLLHVLFLPEMSMVEVVVLGGKDILGRVNNRTPLP